MSDGFTPYLAKDRRVGPFTFDMYIEDPVAEGWYGPQDQWLHERQWCIDTIRPGFTVFDCGAHQGLMTMLFALCTGPAGVVHSWEASKRNAGLISRNAALNDLRNVVVHPRGIGSEPAILPVDENSGNNMVVGQNTRLTATGTVEIVRLDDDIDPSMHVDFLKVDVEGHDLHALKGAERVLSQRPFLMLELHNFLFLDRKETVLEVLSILRRHGYYIWVDDSTPLDIGLDPDPEWLASLERPQMYCVPV